MSDEFDPSLYCELCGKKTNKENINAYNIPGFIHYCDECRKKILNGDTKSFNNCGEK